MPSLEQRAWWVPTQVFLLGGAALVAGLLVWQGLSGAGNPNPAASHIGTGAAVLDTAILVFREGLETILVLAAITASMMGGNKELRRPIVASAGFGLVGTGLTWVCAVAILNVIGQNAPAYDVQAGTGLLAIVVLLVVMNWFFHRVYWTGWISLHNNRKRSLLTRAGAGDLSQSRLLWGLALLGFASIYREGFEVVLFLQGLRLQVGSATVGIGVVIGSALTFLAGGLTFVAHHRLPYKRMLVLTGVMLGVVLLVMVGEEAQEMQLAGWLPTTSLSVPIPGWAGLWFSLFPTLETIAAQVVAAGAVIGAYGIARHMVRRRARLAGVTRVNRPAEPPSSASRQAQPLSPSTPYGQ